METYEATFEGQTRRVTVPADPTPAELLADAIKDTLSPEAVAAVVAALGTVTTNTRDTNRELAWFAEQLVTMVGGPEECNGLIDGIGL